MKRKLNLQNFSILPISKNFKNIPEDGLIYKLPDFCTNKFNDDCREHYKKCPEGFSQCPYGFSTYLHNLDGRTIKWTGIRVKGFYDKKKFEKRERAKRLRVFSKEEVEYFKTTNVHLVKRLDVVLDDKIVHAAKKMEIAEKHTANSFHEIRPLNARIKSTISMMKSILGTLKKDLTEEYKLLKNHLYAIDNSSRLISNRMNLRDFLTNPSLATQGNKKKINIKNEIKSIANMYKYHLRKEKVSLNVNTNRNIQITTYESFKIVLYVIIENAIKYSPSNTAQSIDVIIENENKIVVSSLGPKIHEKEKNRIFEEFKRGEEAVEYCQGSGTGLYAAQTIGNQIDVSIFVVQKDNPAFNFQEKSFYETKFIIRFE